MSHNTKPGTVSPYDLPMDWDAKTDEEKSRWFTQRRCERLAGRIHSKCEQERQDSARKRARRKIEAHPATVPVKR